jgi:hypothetical protein
MSGRGAGAFQQSQNADGRAQLRVDLDCTVDHSIVMTSAET